DNVTIVYRWAENNMDRVPELLADLVRRQVAVMHVGGNTRPSLPRRRQPRRSRSSSSFPKTLSGSAIYTSREFSEIGGLMSYGTNIADAYRQARVGKGAPKRTGDHR